MHDVLAALLEGTTGDVLRTFLQDLPPVLDDATELVSDAQKVPCLMRKWYRVMSQA